MNIRSQIQSILFKTGFIFFICIPQSQTFSFSEFDTKRLPFRNKVELVSNTNPAVRGHLLSYFSYKQLLSDFFTTKYDKIVRYLLYNRTIRIYNIKIRIVLNKSYRLFLNKIAPILNNEKALELNHLLKIETLTCSA